MKKLSYLFSTIFVCCSLSVFAENEQTNNSFDTKNYSSIDDKSLKQNTQADKELIEISIVPFAYQPGNSFYVGEKFNNKLDLGPLVGQTQDVVSNNYNKTVYTESNWNWGITGTLSMLLPSNAYADLSYTYYNISIYGVSPGLTNIDLNTPASVLNQNSGKFKVTGSGAYQIGDFYIRTDVSFGEKVNHFWHNQLCVGLSFQTINRDLKISENYFHGAINSRTNAEYKRITFGKSDTSSRISGTGPSFKWITMLDILSKKLQPHELSLTGELKMAPLFAHQYSKSLGSGLYRSSDTDLVLQPPSIITLNDKFEARFSSQYFLLFNTSFKAGLEYTYKKIFTFGLGYKISKLSQYTYDYDDISVDYGSYDWPSEEATSNLSIDADDIELHIGFNQHILFGSIECELKYRF